MPITDRDVVNDADLHWRPAYHCEHAVHTLTWDLIYPGQSTQGWILRRSHPAGDWPGMVIATVDGYPLGQPPVTATQARTWADQTIGAEQAWIEQPARSGAFHTHT